MCRISMDLFSRVKNWNTLSATEYCIFSHSSSTKSTSFGFAPSFMSFSNLSGTYCYAGFWVSLKTITMLWHFSSFDSVNAIIAR